MIKVKTWHLKLDYLELPKTWFDKDWGPLISYITKYKCDFDMLYNLLNRFSDNIAKVFLKEGICQTSKP